MIVSYLIEVPDGNYCWDKRIVSNVSSCKYFDNEGGHERCLLDFYPQKRVTEGVLKAPCCVELKEIG